MARQWLSVYVGCYYGCFSKVHGSLPVGAIGEVWSQQQAAELLVGSCQESLSGEEHFYFANPLLFHFRWKCQHHQPLSLNP